MVNRYNTGNPRPSNRMKDLNDNALAYDDFMRRGRVLGRGVNSAGW